jgi:hypothetical protein
MLRHSVSVDTTQQEILWPTFKVQTQRRFFEQGAIATNNQKAAGKGLMID